MTVEIKFIEHRRPRPALATPEGAQARPGPMGESELYTQHLSNQNDAIAREIEALDSPPSPSQGRRASRK